ncbi:MAG: hypothetical protein ACLS34_06255 [Faecalibacterium sp.]
MSARSAANETAARREAENPSTVAREELLAKIAEIRAALQTDADNGIAYATDKLEAGGTPVTSPAWLTRCPS